MTEPQLIKMYHPELPGQIIDVLDPRSVPIRRQSGWRTLDELPDKDQKEIRDAEEQAAKQAATDNEE